MRMQQESADWICPGSIDWKQYDQVRCRFVVKRKRVFSVIDESHRWIDAHLRTQGYDPNTGLPVGMTQQDFDERNSEYQLSKKIKVG